MAAGQTIVEYNDVQIRQCLTTHFEQVEERDPSGTDTIFHRFSITVVGYIHGKDTPEASVGFTPRSTDGNASDNLKEIRKLLSTARKPFKMTMGAASGSAGDTVLEAVPAEDSQGRLTSKCDVSNGPRCTRINVTQVVGNEIFRAEVSFEICLAICDPYFGQSENRVLSNRWTVSDSINKDKYTTRTFSGQLRTTGGHFNPNSFRPLVVPSVMPGMRVTAMNFTVSEDGLWLKYEIIHGEVAYSAPAPATSWDVVHTERTSLYDPIGVGDIVVSLTGDRNVDRRELIALGLRVMNDRLRDGASLRVNNHYLQNLSISDYFGSEGPLRVTVSATVRHVVLKPPNPGDDPVEEHTVFSTAKIGTPIDEAIREINSEYDSNVTVKPGAVLEHSGPVDLAGAFVSYLQRPCGQNHQSQCNTEILTEIQPTRNNCNLSLTVVDREFEEGEEEYSHDVSDAHAEAIYESYEMESTYDTPANRAAMPIAKDYYSAGHSLAVISLAPPTTVRKMRMRAVRIGAAPRFPQPVTTYSEEDGTVATLLDTIVMPATSEKTPDGHDVFTVDAEYVYALSKPLTSLSSPRIGVNHWQEPTLQRMSPAVTGSYSEDEVAG